MSASPVTPITTSVLTLDNNAPMCDKLKALHSAGDVIKELVTYLFDNNGNPAPGFIDALGAALSPVGAASFWLMPSVPNGFIILNGQAVDRVTYANLFAVYGTAYGAGNGTTSFNLPDMTDRVPVGASANKAVGSKAGAATVTLLSAQIPNLAPTMKSPVDGIIVHVTSGGTGGIDAGGGVKRMDVADALSIGATAPQPVDITPPYFAGHWITRY